VGTGQCLHAFSLISLVFQARRHNTSVCGGQVRTSVRTVVPVYVGPSSVCNITSSPRAAAWTGLSTCWASKSRYFSRLSMLQTSASGNEADLDTVIRFTHSGGSPAPRGRPSTNYPRPFANTQKRQKVRSRFVSALLATAESLANLAVTRVKRTRGRPRDPACLVTGAAKWRVTSMNRQLTVLVGCD
jgi:hypothetical protein